MQSEFSLPLLLLISASLCGIGIVLAHVWRSRLSGRSDGTRDSSGIVYTARFDICEISRIRDALGGSLADALMQKLAERLASALSPDQQPLVGPSSISCPILAVDPDEAGSMLQAAMTALTRKASVSGIEFYCSAKASITPGMSCNIAGLDETLPKHTAEQDLDAKLDLLRALPDALATSQVTLEYQPKRALRSGQVDSAEALLRWRRHDGSMAHTGDLITLIETTGAIKDVTLWTVQQAIADSKRLRHNGHDLAVFINMSGGLLSDTDYCQSVQKLVKDAGCNIGIEITETAVINDPATAIENLREFARAGIAVAIDDFGAGLSSLEYLQQLPACELKIDRNFIAKLSSSNRNPLIVKATIDLAHALEMKVTAEGVDDPLSLALLKVMGCDMAQGFLISPPLPVAELSEYLAENEKLLSQKAAVDEARQGIV
jgi:diguanylate cyclase